MDTYENLFQGQLAVLVQPFEMFLCERPPRPTITDTGIVEKLGPAYPVALARRDEGNSVTE